MGLDSDYFLLQTAYLTFRFLFFLDHLCHFQLLGGKGGIDLANCASLYFFLPHLPLQDALVQVLHLALEVLLFSLVLAGLDPVEEGEGFL